MWLLLTISLANSSLSMAMDTVLWKKNCIRNWSSSYHFCFRYRKNGKFEKLFTTFTWRSNRRYMLSTKRWHKGVSTFCSPEKKGRVRERVGCIVKSIFLDPIPFEHWPSQFIKNQDDFNYTVSFFCKTFASHRENRDLWHTKNFVQLK